MSRVFTFLFALSLAAQDPQFNVRSRLVLVPTTVTDHKGAPVDGLEPADFVLLDNGRPQKIVVDETATGVAPIALVIAVESAGISRVVLEHVRKIASLIEPYVTGERGCTALVAFDERVQWLQECTRNYVELKQAFARLQHGEPKRARMLDAAQEAIERLKKRANSRRVLLLISESRDRGSKVSLDDIRVAAQAADVVVYATTYSAFKTAFTSKSSATGEPEAPKKIYRRADQTGTINGQEEGHANPSLPPAEQRVDILGGLSELSRLGKANTTQVLTSATGGDTFPFTREKGLIEAIQKLGVELHTQYMLSFTPATPDPGYHRIEVRLMRRGDFHVRARTGYWSTN